MAWIAALIMSAALGLANAGSALGATCRPGAWVDPATGAELGHDEVLARAAARTVVLLGETHDDAEHHRWQLSVLGGLLAREPGLAVGFEALPARAQPVLDRWVAGELDESAFLEAVEWRKVWGLPAELYLPLFHLARLHRRPALGLNVERALVSRVGREGWAAIPVAEREGVGDPATPPADYVDRLASSYREHAPSEHGDVADADVEGDPGFRRFVEAQLTWDRAMAEVLARASRTSPLVVGIVGSEHVRQGGIPHQLEAIGVAAPFVLLPEAAEGCEDLRAGGADAVFLLGTPR